MMSTCAVCPLPASLPGGRGAAQVGRDRNAAPPPPRVSTDTGAAGLNRANQGKQFDFADKDALDTSLSEGKGWGHSAP